MRAAARSCRRLPRRRRARARRGRLRERGRGTRRGETARARAREAPEKLRRHRGRLARVVGVVARARPDACRLGDLVVQVTDLRDDRLQPRVRDLARPDQLERRLAELVVRAAQLALLLDVFDAFLRLRRRLLGGSLCLVEKSHCSRSYSRILPRRPPDSPCPLPAAASTRRAVREKGRVWRVACPGPVMWTRKRPSPPNKLFAIPPCSFTS